MHIQHTAQAGFEAARRIDSLPEDHPKKRLHGHSFLARLRGTTDAHWASFAGGEVDQLHQHLAAGVEMLDHAYLNNLVPNPTDTHLAMWLQQRLPIKGLHVQQVGVQSTRNSGVEIDALGQVHVWRRYVLHAAHQLPNVPEGHKCGRMHGHGFEVLLHARQIGSTPVDVDRLDALWLPLHQLLDHACLNDIPGLQNPTSEVISGWLWKQLKPMLPELTWVTVYETASCGASHDGHHYRIWKEMTLDSAVRLRHAPELSPLHRLHGHTFTLRLHLCAPLDDVMGWTVDFGDVKRLFDPIFKALDHRPLHELAGLPDCDCASLAQWVLGQACHELPALNRVDLYKTPGCGAIALLGESEAALPI